jgi:hypothetical protein
MRLQAFHSRPLVQAVLAELAIFNDGRAATSDQVNIVAKALNTAARTVLLDAVTPDGPLDASASEAWLAGASEVDEAALFIEDPEGPLEDVVPPAQIAAARALLREVIGNLPSSRTTTDVSDDAG